MIQFFDPEVNQIITEYDSFIEIIHFIQNERKIGLWDKWSTKLYGKNHEHINLIPYLSICGGTPASRLYGSVTINKKHGDHLSFALFNIVVNRILVDCHCVLTLDGCGVFEGELKGNLCLSRSILWGNMDISNNSFITAKDCDIRECHITNGFIMNSVLHNCKIDTKNCKVFNSVLNDCDFRTNSNIINCLEQ